jgi:hypothetical protein
MVGVTGLMVVTVVAVILVMVGVTGLMVVTVEAAGARC